jgi:hypothetical protein
MPTWIFIVLAHWINSLQVDISLHQVILLRLRANQHLRFLLNVACLAEKQQIPILESGFICLSVWDSNLWSITLEASTLYITPLMQLILFPCSDESVNEKCLKQICIWTKQNFFLKTNLIKTRKKCFRYCT